MQSIISCGKCGKNFIYRWIPFASLTTIRMGNKRYLRCPVCKKWSFVDIRRTQKINSDKLPVYDDMKSSILVLASTALIIMALAIWILFKTKII